MNVVRWLLVPVAAAVAWAASIAVGLVLHDGIERLCPADAFVSGLCVAPWFPIAQRAVFCASAALAAISVLLGCTLTAPQYRAVVASGVFIVGSVVAVAMAVAAHAYLEGVSALGAAVLLFMWLRRRGWHIGRPKSTSLKQAGP